MAERESRRDRDDRMPIREMRELTDRQRETLEEIGRYRIIPIKELAKFGYSGDSKEMLKDLRALGGVAPLVRYQSIYSLQDESRTMAAFLTSAGRAEANCQGQLVYSWNRLHDVQVYPAVMRDVARLHADGCRVDCVLMEGELKRFKSQMFNEISKEKRSPSASELKEIASILGLRVMEQKGQPVILIPDAQIRYRTPSGDAGVLNVEVVTATYTGAEIRGKQASGFTIHQGGTRAGAPVRDEHSIWR